MEGSVEALLTLGQAGEDWETVLFEGVCGQAREWAQQLLEGVDEALAATRAPGWVVEGYRTRILVTRFGPVRIRRRLYRKGKRRCFLLDEHLGWRRREALSPTLRTAALELVARVPYRTAAELIGKFVSQATSAMTVHRAVQAVGQATRTKERLRRQAAYEQGQALPAGTMVADPLFVEADGVSVALQRESGRRAEVKIAMASSGRTPLGRTGTDRRGRSRRAVVGKVSHAGLEDGPRFWEDAWLTFGAHYDLDRTNQVVLGGDGASWIQTGLTGVTGGLFQLDRFHLARELRRVLGPTGMIAFQAARTGNDAELKRLLAEAWRASGNDPVRWTELQRLEGYLSQNRHGLVDWYRRIPGADGSPSATDSGLRVTLGAMEANVDKPYANRLKKRGMSWTKRGVHHLVKVLQLAEAGELAGACQTRPVPLLLIGPKPHPASAATTKAPAARGSPPPLQARFAPRHGPHAARPWVQVLCQMIDGPTIRN